MVSHFGLGFPPESLEPENSVTPAQIDEALRVLAHSGDTHLKNALFRRLRSVPRELVRERMAAVRPLPAAGMSDPMGRVVIHPAPAHSFVENAIVIQGSGGYQGMIQQLIDTIRRYTRRAGELRFVILANDDGTYQFFCDRHDVLTVRTSSLMPPSTWMKSCVWRVANLVDSAKFLILEADMVCLGDLSPIFDALDAADERAILGVSGTFHDNHFITCAWELAARGGCRADAEFITGVPGFDARYMFNGGTLAGHRRAIQAIEERLDSFYPWLTLTGEGLHTPWMDELGTMLAIEHHGWYGHLHPMFNTQIHWRDRDRGEAWGWKPQIGDDNRLHFPNDTRNARLVHFVADCKQALMPKLHDLLLRHPVQP